MPIIALGAAAALDLPDQLTFSQACLSLASTRVTGPSRQCSPRLAALHAGACGCVQVPTKITSKQSLLVRNVGNRATQFLLTASEHFGVSPAEGSLEPGEFMQVCCRPRAHSDTDRLTVPLVH